MKKLETVAIANALQLEAARRRASGSRLYGMIISCRSCIVVRKYAIYKWTDINDFLYLAQLAAFVVWQIASWPSLLGLPVIIKMFI